MQMTSEVVLSKASRDQPIKRAITVNHSQLDRFLGTYDFGKGQVLTISRKGDRLYSKMNDFPALKLYVQNDSTIFYRDLDAWFKFEFDDQNKEIVKTVYVQNGEIGYPKKIK